MVRAFEGLACNDSFYYSEHFALRRHAQYIGAELIANPPLVADNLKKIRNEA